MLGKTPSRVISKRKASDYINRGRCAVTKVGTWRAFDAGTGVVWNLRALLIPLARVENKHVCMLGYTLTDSVTKASISRVRAARSVRQRKYVQN